MQAERLFLERCRQIESQVRSDNEIDLLDMAGSLRQLLLEGLVHKANVQPRLKLTFHVGNFGIQPDQYTQILSLEDGLDPETARPGKSSKQVDADGFIGHTVLYLNGSPHSVGDVIKLAANVAGGVHHGNPREAQRLIAEYSANFGIGGLPGAIRQLKAIGRVALKGFSPLVVALEGRPSVS